MKKIILTVLLGLGIVGNSFSQNFWTKVNHQGHAFRFGMATDGTVYGLSNQTFLYKSTTNGTLGSWNQLTGFPVENSYNVFVKGNTVFMLNGDGVEFDGLGIYVSTDGGNTWTTRNNGLGSTNVGQIFQLANGVLLVNVGIDPTTNDTYLSSDNGMNWTAGQTFNGSSSFGSLVVISANEAYMAGGNTIFKSTNNGQTWVDQNSTAPSQMPYRIVGNNNGDLLGVANEDVLESTDQGVTWTVKTLTGLPTLTSAGDNITSLKRLHGETVYAAVADNAGIYYSEDWGSTWTNITSNIPSTQIFNDDLAVSTGGYLFASPSGSGIYRSTERVTPSSVGLAENSKDLSGVVVYPNPAADKVFIDSEANGKGSVGITNQYGQTIYSTSFESFSDLNNGIDISGFSSGVYFVKVKTLEGVAVQKLIKE